jgi:hypothetical protein
MGSNGSASPVYEMYKEGHGEAKENPYQTVLGEIFFFFEGDLSLSSRLRFFGVFIGLLISVTGGRKMSSRRTTAVSAALFPLLKWWWLTVKRASTMAPDKRRS